VVSPRVTGSLRPEDFLIILDLYGEMCAFQVEGWEIDIRAGAVRPVFASGMTTDRLSPFTQVRLVSRETSPEFLFEAAERMVGSQSMIPTRLLPRRRNTDNGEAHETVDSEGSA